MLALQSSAATLLSWQDYLETKRVAFPRFYFVAPADLLDILSKGSDPQLILRCDAVKLQHQCQEHLQALALTLTQAPAQKF